MSSVIANEQLVEDIYQLLKAGKIKPASKKPENVNYYFLNDICFALINNRLSLELIKRFGAARNKKIGDALREFELFNGKLIYYACRQRHRVAVHLTCEMFSEKKEGGF